MEQLIALYKECFPDKNAQKQIKALGSNFEFLVLEEKCFVIFITVSVDEVEIIDIGTLPEFRGLGWGKRILNKLHEELEKRSITTVYLEVAENNAAALKLYDQCGYVKYSMRKDYYRAGDKLYNAVLMKKSI